MHAPTFDLTADPYFAIDAADHLTASFDKATLTVEPRDDGYHCSLASNGDVIACYRTTDPREVLALAVVLDNDGFAKPGSNLRAPKDAPFTGFRHEGRHVGNPFANAYGGGWHFREGHELADPHESVGPDYEAWLHALAARRAEQGREYTVNVYREMRLVYPGIRAASPEEAARIAFNLPTKSAETIEDCEGTSHSALVDRAGDPEYQHSVTIDNPFSPTGQQTANTAALRACDLLIAAYEEGGKQGGSVQWEDLDQAHEAALEARKRAPRAGSERPPGFVQMVEQRRQEQQARARP